MKLSFVTILFVAFFVSIYGTPVGLRIDIRCNAVPGTVATEGISCFASFRRYTYVQETDSCEEYIYGGCGGSANNFWTQAECESSCRLFSNILVQ